MRNALLVALALAACAHPVQTVAVREPIVAPALLDDAVRVRRDETFYDVHGRSPREVRAQLDRLRPVGERGSYDALTKWHVQWNYPHLEERGRCRAGEPRIDVTIGITLPRWREGARDAGWRRYFAGLMEHEDGHAEHGRAAGQAVLERLRRLPPARDCAALDAEATRAGMEEIRKFNDADLEYDARTRHGESQGAIFP